MHRTVHIHAPSRLHFGLMSFGRKDGRQFGGVGMMVREPRLELLIQAADAFVTSGPLAGRVAVFARNAARRWKLADLPPCRVQVVAAPPEHHGLGSGTQLALSVAAGIRAYRRLTPLSECELAASVGRGRRSSVGVYGFFHGGLIFEEGHAAGESLGQLGARVPLPEVWRLVLIRAPGPVGQYGAKEVKTFADLPPVPHHVTDRLSLLASADIIPAAQAAAFDEFSASVYEYGRLAGECFATCQGGPFASPTIANLIISLRDWGVRGVGQSSWGPTVFALTRDGYQASEIVANLRKEPAWAVCGVTVTTPCNEGASVEVVADK